MTINQLTAKARDKSNFLTLQGYLDFCQSYLDYVAVAGNLQAVIVSRNENHYRFWQYDRTTGYQVTRPINSQLMYQAGEFEPVRQSLLTTLRSLKDGGLNAGLRSSLNNAVYTLQQSIGAALDGLPAGERNTARKLNGDLFERLIQLIL